MTVAELIRFLQTCDAQMEIGFTKGFGYADGTSMEFVGRVTEINQKRIAVNEDDTGIEIVVDESTSPGSNLLVLS